MEPVSLGKKSVGRSSGDSDRVGKWRKQPAKPHTKAKSVTDMGMKKRDTHMEVDSIDVGALKKSKFVTEDSSISKAESMEQPPQAL